MGTPQFSLHEQFHDDLRAKLVETLVRVIGEQAKEPDPQDVISVLAQLIGDYVAAYPEDMQQQLLDVTVMQNIRYAMSDNASGTA